MNLCKLGIHRPLRKHSFNFIEKVTDLSIYDAECPCGKKWMTNSPLGWGFKVEKKGGINVISRNTKTTKSVRFTHRKDHERPGR